MTFRVCSSRSCNRPSPGLAARFCPWCGSPTVAPDAQWRPFAMKSLQDLPGYRIVQRLADGPYACLFLAEYGDGPSLHRVAIKTLQDDLANDHAAVTRLQREAEVLAQLRHPNSVRLFATGEQPRPFLMLEYIEGTPLSSHLGNGAWRLDFVAEVLRAVCGALGELHAIGYVYRGISPENILVRMDNPNVRTTRLIDFIVARKIETAANKSSASSGNVTRQTEILGVPTYMSPEQFSNRPLDARSDIYSLAVLVYELVTGELPFQAATQWDWATCHVTQPPIPLETHVAGRVLPAHWRSTILASLAKSARERPATMAEFLTRLGLSP